MRNRKVFVLAIGVAFALASAAAQQEGAPPSAAQRAPSFGGEKCLARASRDSTMGFTFPTEVREVVVKGGDAVKKGDILILGNGDEARYTRDLQKLVAETDLDVKRAAAALKQAQVEFDAQKQIKEQVGGAPVEFQRAEAQFEIRTVEVEIAKFQQTQQRLNLSLREAQVERTLLRAPFDGIVDQVVVDAGEVKRDGEPVIRVVAVDPLWIDVAAPVAQTITLGLKPGADAWVLMDLPGEPAVHRAKVVEVSPAVDEGSNTRRVRVELRNPAQWPAGLTCWVRFTEPTGEWAARIITDRGGGPAASAGPGDDLEAGNKR